MKLRMKLAELRVLPAHPDNELEGSALPFAELPMGILHIVNIIHANMSIYILVSEEYFTVFNIDVLYQRSRQSVL